MYVHSKAKEISETTNGDIDVIESDLNHFIDDGNSKEWAVDRVKQLHKMADVIGPSQPAFRRRAGRKLKSKIGIEENSVKGAGIRIRKLSEAAETITSEHYVEKSTVLSEFFDELDPTERVDDIEQRLSTKYAAIEELAQKYDISRRQVKTHASELAEEGETVDELRQRLDSRYSIAAELAPELGADSVELMDKSVSVSSKPTSTSVVKNQLRENFISDAIDDLADELSSNLNMSSAEVKSQISPLRDEDTSIHEIEQQLKKHYSLSEALTSELELNQSEIHQLETFYETVDVLSSKFDIDSSEAEVENKVTKLVEKEGRTIDEARDQLEKRYEATEKLASEFDIGLQEVEEIATKSIQSSVSVKDENQQITKISSITDELISTFDIHRDVTVEVILLVLEEGVPPNKIETRLKKRYSTAKEISSDTDIELAKLMRVAVAESPHHNSSNVVENRVREQLDLPDPSSDSGNDPPDHDYNAVEVDKHAEELASALGVDEQEVKSDLESLLQYSVPLKEAKQSVRRKHGGGDGGRSDPSSDSLPLSEIRADLDDVTITVRVLTVGVRTIQYQGDEQTIREGRFGDETGTISYTAWQDFGFEPGDSVVIGNVGVREREGKPELNLATSTSVAMADEEVATDAKIGGDSDLVDLSPGDRGRNIEVTVKEVDTRTTDGRNGETEVLSGILADDTARLPFTDWDPHNVIEMGGSCRIEDVYIREHRGSPSINITEFSIVNPLSDSVATPEPQTGDSFSPDDRRPDEIPGSTSVSISYDALTDEEPIGGGGNADVRKAIFPASEPEVTLAIKEPRMNGTLHRDQIDQMLREAETWDKLDTHDHIVQVVDYGSDPLPWIAMEYMDGGPLAERIGELPLSQALWTATTVTKGVCHAHRKGIAHLDLKPANILFRSIAGGWDVPKVADWGLSKHLLDQSNSVEGLSYQYAAPEQFDDEYGATDDITDIYQLGAVFYELFTGRPPFDGKPFEVIRKIQDESPTPPSEIADVPDKLDEILLKSLAKQKDDRYEHILFLRDDLADLFDTIQGEKKSSEH